MAGIKISLVSRQLGKFGWYADDKIFTTRSDGVNNPFSKFLHVLIFQVGNAVPPPMAREIGQEIKKCLVWKQKQINSEEKVRIYKRLTRQSYKTPSR
jgi:hypothetical protein